jgi:acylaminoacyl-peptidase
VVILTAALLCAAAACAAPVPAFPADPGAAPPRRADRFTEMDLFDLEMASDPQIAPDGRGIAYVREFSDIFTDKSYSNLWLVSLDGSDHRPLTSGHQADDSPRWSPDGRRLAFVSDRDGTPQIYVLWLDSGQVGRLTNLGYPPSGLAWSPDGRQIAFATFVPTEPPKYADMPEPPENTDWAPSAAVIDTMVYRFDKAGYLKPGFTHLFVIPAEGGTPRQISSGDYQHGGAAFKASEPVWTPDGRHILMSAVRKPDWELDPYDTEIYEFSVSDGSVRPLTRRKGPDDSPAVSPDGGKIAYLGFDERYQGYQVTRLYVMNRDGSDSRVVAEKLNRDVVNPRWARDGSGLFFLYDDHGNTKVAFTTLEGKVRVLAGDVGGPGGAYGDGTYSTNGSAYAFSYSRPHVPSDIAAGTVAEGGSKVITAVNQDLLGHKKLGEVEEIRYESSLDKRPMQGWIVKPPDFDPKRKYPLILEIHGGPWANYGDRWETPYQIWAAKGYVVLYTNPRGSTSYGEEFGNLTHHAYPGDDFHDLNSGVDAAIQKGYVDPRNLFVTGGSGGGVLTCWMIGRTDRFAGAATLYPVINWYSMVGTTDVPVWTYRYVFPGPPWEHFEQYEKRSLLSVVKNVKTPTMVMTGEEDWRTPISEAEQYYRALKILGVESVFVRVPGEPHGIWQRPSHRLENVLNILGWFDKHRR